VVARTGIVRCRICAEVRGCRYSRRPLTSTNALDTPRPSKRSWSRALSHACPSGHVSFCCRRSATRRRLRGAPWCAKIARRDRRSLDNLYRSPRIFASATRVDLTVKPLTWTRSPLAQSPSRWRNGVSRSAAGMGCRARAVVERPSVRGHMGKTRRRLDDRPTTYAQPCPTAAHDSSFDLPSGEARDHVCPMCAKVTRAQESIPTLTWADAPDRPCPLKAVAGLICRQRCAGGCTARRKAVRIGGSLVDAKRKESLPRCAAEVTAAFLRRMRCPRSARGPCRGPSPRISTAWPLCSLVGERGPGPLIRTPWWVLGGARWRSRGRTVRAGVGRARRVASGRASLRLR